MSALTLIAGAFEAKRNPRVVFKSAEDAARAVRYYASLSTPDGKVVWEGEALYRTAADAQREAEEFLKMLSQVGAL